MDSIKYHNVNVQGQYVCSTIAAIKGMRNHIEHTYMLYSEQLDLMRSVPVADCGRVIGERKGVLVSVVHENLGDGSQYSIFEAASRVGAQLNELIDGVQRVKAPEMRSISDMLLRIDSARGQASTIWGVSGGASANDTVQLANNSTVGLKETLILIITNNKGITSQIVGKKARARVTYECTKYTVNRMLQEMLVEGVIRYVKSGNDKMWYIV